MYQNVFDDYNVKPRHSLFKILAVILILTCIIFCVTALLRIFSTANSLIAAKRDSNDELANNLLPTHDAVTFSLHQDAPTLNGLYFRSKQWPAKANVIFIPDHHTDHLQYGLKTGEVFDFFIEHGYNVFAYDPQGTGKSEGDISTYGYSEYQDVIAAMSACKRISGFTDFVLYGVGTGTNAAVFAWDNLPEEVLAEDDRKAEWENVDFSKQDIKAFICDTPTSTVAESIRADIADDNFWDREIIRRFVPLAIRISTGTGNPDNLVQLYSRIQMPVFMMYNDPDNHYDNKAINSIVSERRRLVPALTDVFTIKQEGHLEIWGQDNEKLIKKLQQFIDRWMSQPK